MSLKATAEFRKAGTVTGGLGYSQRKKLTIVFGNSESHSKYSPFKQPFADFAKAFVRYQQSLNYKNSVMWASSLAWIYNALEESAIQNGREDVDIMHLTNTDINRTRSRLRLVG